MSSTYTGDKTSITARQSTVITIPSDGDALTAASNNTPDKTLADLIDFLMKNALLGEGYSNVPATSNTIGARFTGNGTGAGLNVSGGSGGGIGISANGTGSSAGGVFTSAGGLALQVTGNTFASALKATAGGGGNFAVEAVGASGAAAVMATGASGQPGLRAASASTAADVIQADGWVNMSGANSPTTVADKRLTPQGILRAAVRFTTTAGTPPTIVQNSGFNINALAIDGSSFVAIDLEQVAVGTELIVVVTDFNTSGSNYNIRYTVVSISSGGAGGRTRITLRPYNSTTGASAAAISSAGAYVAVFSMN